MAAIHAQLLADCVPLGRFPLCHLLLLNDSQYPWFILVPDRDAVSEIYQLDAVDRSRLWHESTQLSEFVMREFDGDKLNLAALGNQVPQLHLHHIVRYRSDPAWPTPVWGKLPAIAYREVEIGEMHRRFDTSNLADFASA